LGQVLSRSRYVLAPFLAAIAATGSAYAQEQSHEHRLVQAFSAYCIATAAAPGRVEAEIKKVARLDLKGIATYHSGGYLQTAEVVDAVGKGDLHQRMLVSFGWGLGDTGRTRTCQVNMPWGEKAKLIAELIGSLKVDEGASSVIREGQYETDLTRWVTRVGNTEAVVELGLPTFAGAPGRALTLSLEGP
jgi:hypothetical protein